MIEVMNGFIVWGLIFFAIWLGTLDMENGV